MTPRLQSRIIQAMKRVLSAETLDPGVLAVALQPRLEPPARLFSVYGVKRCRVVARLNRFVVEAVLDGRRVYLHTNNTGRLEGLLVEGREGLCAPLVTPGSKTHGRLVALQCCGGYALIDTGLQERGFAEAVAQGLIPWLRGCRVVQRRPRLGGSVLDFLLSCGDARVYVETKSAVMVSDDRYAMFPDTLSHRARRQIIDMINIARQAGEYTRLAIVFIAALPGARGFRPNRRIDPELPRLLELARKAGIMVKAIGIDIDEEGWVRLYHPDLPVDLGEG